MIRRFVMLLGVAGALVAPDQADAGRRARRVYSCPSRCVPTNSCPAQCVPSCACPVACAPAPTSVPQTCPVWYAGEFDGIHAWYAEIYPDCPCPANVSPEPTWLFSENANEYDPPRNCDDFSQPGGCDVSVMALKTNGPIKVPDDGKRPAPGGPWEGWETKSENVVAVDHDANPRTPDKNFRLYLISGARPGRGRPVNAKFGFETPDPPAHPGKLVAANGQRLTIQFRGQDYAVLLQD